MINSDNFEFLVGNNNFSKKPTQPYNRNICNFISDLSNELNKKALSKFYPDVKTFAFWCRKNNIYNLKKKFTTEETRLGLGLIFHITPSNIPTNFAYSLIFGLLTGNSNIVKVPSQKFKQVQIICNSINKLLKNKYKSIRGKISIVRYSKNEDYTKKISSICNARVIWGGDNTINNIRKFPLSFRAIDITFADRYSFCILDTAKFLELNIKEMKRLIERFYNDTYLVDQNACSSPHLILWLGKESKKAKSKFWNHLYYYVGNKYNLTESASIDKFTRLCENILLTKNLKNYKKYGNSIYTVNLKFLNKDIHTLRGKWGIFYEYNIKTLNKIKKYINTKYQTLTYFGLNKQTLKNFIIKNHIQGIDRIVPIGQALDIDLFWDGYDINKVLSRVIDIK
jgi:hypothetical protein